MRIEHGNYVIKFLDDSEKVFDTLVRADLSEADLRGADLFRADLRGANLYEANLHGASLRGASLTRADLTRADLTRANLTGANLTGVDLYGANLSHCKGVVGFYLGEHFGFMSLHNQSVKIGCRQHSLDFWLEYYQTIGKHADYFDEMIRRYGIQLRALKEMIND